MLDVRTIAVENWLRQFRRQDGDDLAYSTKAYSTMLIANGENVNVIQELMRHANSRTTLEVYSQARISAKREAQQRIVHMILPDEEMTSEIRLQRNGAAESLGGAE